MADVRLCAIVPTFDNPLTIRQTVKAVRNYVEHVIVVDDGSGEDAAQIVRSLAGMGVIQLIRHPTNCGKGAAVKTGLKAAHFLGFTHALQIDADGQHHFEDIPKFIELAHLYPTCCIVAQPIFDASAPFHRRAFRWLTRFWVCIEVGDDRIGDPMCGFRVYPVEAALRTGAFSNRMEFDIEVAVRLAWAGMRFVHVPSPVRYLKPEEGGVSHWRVFRDTWLLSKMHTRLMIEKVSGWLKRFTME
ncbi:MAG: glycosyltransferase family 2 protein [Sandaracinaceae bacterium]|nr:glycosyltransferase family 2 protein [Sandaracinaceae bacterium]